MFNTDYATIRGMITQALSQSKATDKKVVVEYEKSTHHVVGGRIYPKTTTIRVVVE